MPFAMPAAPCRLASSNSRSILASSNKVTVLAWLTCPNASMSDQRGLISATNTPNATTLQPTDEPRLVNRQYSLAVGRRSGQVEPCDVDGQATGIGLVDQQRQRGADGGDRR